MNIKRQGMVYSATFLSETFPDIKQTVASETFLIPLPDWSIIVLAVKEIQTRAQNDLGE